MLVFSTFLINVGQKVSPNSLPIVEILFTTSVLLKMPIFVYILREKNTLPKPICLRGYTAEATFFQ